VVDFGTAPLDLLPGWVDPSPGVGSLLPLNQDAPAFSICCRPRWMKSLADCALADVDMEAMGA
jgi:hypothetical protein